MDFSEKKQPGDVAEIRDWLANKGISYSKRMVSYMLNGERTMPKDVYDVVEKYYEYQNKTEKLKKETLAQ